MKKQRTLRRRITGSQIIGLIMMLAGFATIFATGISASKHGDHILTESESEYMDSGSDEEQDLLEKWISTRESTRKAAVFPLMLISGFLIVGGAPLFYTPIAVEAHQSRMSRKEDAEERKARNRGSHASRKLDRELKKEEERALAEAEAIRAEQKKKWERRVAERAKEALDSDNAQSAAPAPAAKTKAEDRPKQESRKAAQRKNTKPAAEKPQKPAGTASDLPAPDAKAAPEQEKTRSYEESLVLFLEQLSKLSPDIKMETITSSMPETVDLCESEEEKQNRSEAQQYIEKYSGDQSKAEPKLGPADLAFLTNTMKESAETEELYAALRKKRAESWISSGVMEEASTGNNAAADEKAAAAPAQESRPDAGKPKPAGNRPKTNGKKKKNNRKKSGKRRKHLLF